MLLGKRPRPPIKRTTSMTGITVDITNAESSASDGPDQQNPHASLGQEVLPGSYENNHDHQSSMMMNFGTNHHHDQRFLTAMVSPRNFNSHLQQRERSRSNSNDFIETPHFLKSCGLCKRRLHPGRDIYMYRYDYLFSGKKEIPIRIFHFWYLPSLGIFFSNFLTRV